MSENLSFSDNAIKVLKKRYLKRDKSSNSTETAFDMFRRVAETIAKGDLQFGKTNEEILKLSDDFFEIMTKKYFLPNSPTLMNAGRELGQLSACFVLPIEDSIESIFETLKNTALIHKSGGGTGFSFSRIRSKNSIVKSTMGVASGPVSFMDVFNSATEAIKQGGTRRGANMGILRIDHPDIIEFIECKSNNNKLNNFNISVAITDKFMQALKNNEEYELINPQDKSVSRKISARYVFDLIVNKAWQNGEPGIIFIDKINANNPTPKVGEIESTNPCGEVPLLPYEACNLGSINLGQMVNDKKIDWQLLQNTVKTAVHFLDNVIEINKFPLPQIKHMVESNRKIGLGIMGLADLLYKLEISYASEAGINLAGQIMEFIDYVSKCESIELSRTRGRFKNFDKSVYANKNYFYNKYKNKSFGKITDEQWLELDKKISEFGIRNATTTCIAPTGTISIIASATCGIEPIFGLVFSRLILDGTEMLEINPIFKKYAIDHNFYSKKLMYEIAKTGSITKFNNIDETTKQIFLTAHDISPYWHIKMQAACQVHTDNAVSKTINFEESATKNDIEKAYLLAYENNLKGITVYRNNSRQFQPMNFENEQMQKITICPECGFKIQMAEGCYICPQCGYSGCS